MSIEQAIARLRIPRDPLAFLADPQNIAMADQAQSELDALRARVAELEERNAELRKELGTEASASQREIDGLRSQIGKCKVCGSPLDIPGAPSV